jgi:hypothetical protein
VNETSGNGFHASWCSKKACEGVAGVRRPDGSILMADEDGIVFGDVIDDAMNLCYVQSGEDFRIAACSAMKKAP